MILALIIGLPVLMFAWLAWEFYRAPLLDDDERPVDDERAMAVVIGMDAWRAVPHERRHGGEW